MLNDVRRRAILNTLLFGVGWGIGALSMGISFRYLGMAITYAVVLGIGSSIGTLVPLAVLQPGKTNDPCWHQRHCRSRAGSHRNRACLLGCMVSRPARQAGRTVERRTAREHASDR